MTVHDYGVFNSKTLGDQAMMQDLAGKTALATGSTSGPGQDEGVFATKVVTDETLEAEVRAFLTEGTRTGKLSFLSPSGRPLVTPVWFVVEDDTLVFNTGKDTAKGRALARDPRVSLCVDLEAPPYAFVQVQGAAELSEDPDELVRTATAIAARYMGPERAEEFGKRNGVPGELVVRVRPVKVRADFNMIGMTDAAGDPCRRRW
jgi:PPOX class probable F420-dependent enzyme